MAPHKRTLMQQHVRSSKRRRAQKDLGGIKDGEIRYDSRKYWEQRYTHDKEAFDWFFEYHQFKRVLERHLRKRKNSLSTIVDLGCGNSTLLFKLYEDGYGGKMYGFDYSTAVINDMRSNTSKQKLSKAISFKVVDITEKIPLNDNTVDLCFDKSTMDCIMHSTSWETLLCSMFHEIARVLKLGGIYVLFTQLDHSKDEGFSFLTEIIFSNLSAASTNSHWKCTVHSSSSHPLHIYMFEKLPMHGMLRRSQSEHESQFLIKTLLY